MTLLFIADFSELSAADIDVLSRGLSLSRQEHIKNTKSPRAMAQRVVAGSLLEYALGEAGYKGEIAYRYDENGKPFLDATDAPFISISHSGSFAAAAVSEHPVGIDIEADDAHKRADFERIAERFFSPSEVAWIGEDRRRFFTVWTYKEAYAKACGERVAEHLSEWDYIELAEGAEPFFAGAELFYPDRFGRTLRIEPYNLHGAKAHDTTACGDLIFPIYAEGFTAFFIDNAP